MSIATGQDCIGTNLHLVGKLLQIHWTMYAVRSNRYVARFFTVLSTGRACRSPWHTCRDMSACTGTVCLMAILIGGTFTGSTVESQFAGRNELLTRVWPAPVSSKRAKVPHIPPFMHMEIRNRFAGFQNIVESSRQSSRLLQLFLSSILSFESTLSTRTFRLVEGYYSDPVLSVTGVYPLVAIECSRITACLLEDDEVLTKNCV